MMKATIELKQDQQQDRMNENINIGLVEDYDIISENQLLFQFSQR